MDGSSGGFSKAFEAGQTVVKKSATTLGKSIGTTVTAVGSQITGMQSPPSPSSMIDTLSSGKGTAGSIFENIFEKKSASTPVSSENIGVSQEVYKQQQTDKHKLQAARDALKDLEAQMAKVKNDREKEYQEKEQDKDKQPQSQTMEDAPIPGKQVSSGVLNPQITGTGSKEASRTQG